MSTSLHHAARAQRRTARAEAAAWIVRLHGPHRSPELEAAFKHWLEVRPENARQFERVTEIWDTTQSFPAEGIAWPALLEEKTSAQTWARAAVVLLMCGVTALAAYKLWFDSTYITDIGEQRVVRLADGTRVSLNASTHVVVDYDKAARRLQLEQGEAFFDVAADARRPFEVHVGERRITALGTSFVVRYDGQRTSVTLIDGKVAVTPGAAQPDIILTPGERLTFGEGTQTLAMDEPRIDAVTAWRRGEVLLDRTPLAEAVAEMNRYDQLALVIDDAAIRQIKVSGIYQTGDSEGFASDVARLYGLEIHKQRGAIYLRRPSEP